jgi:hypothetical protein
MTMPSWTFSALGFAVLCRAAGRDVLPYPLQFRSTAGTAGEFEAQWKAEAGDIAGRADDDLEAAVRILLGPEARIEMAGFAGAAAGSGDLLEMGDPRRRVRMLAAVHYRQAVLLIQEPTVHPESGGAVRISLIRSGNVVRRLFDALPGRARGAGPTVRVNRADLAADADRPFTAFHDGAPRSAYQRAADFERPRTSIVYVAVCPGPAIDRRPTPARDFHVIDYPDGRYLVRHNDSVLRADPADPHLLNTHLQSALTATLTAYREDNGHGHIYT